MTTEDRCSFINGFFAAAGAGAPPERVAAARR